MGDPYSISGSEWRCYIIKEKEKNMQEITGGAGKDGADESKGDSADSGNSINTSSLLLEEFGKQKAKLFSYLSFMGSSMAFGMEIVDLVRQAISHSMGNRHIKAAKVIEQIMKLMTLASIESNGLVFYFMWPLINMLILLENEVISRGGVSGSSLEYVNGMVGDFQERYEEMVEDGEFEDYNDGVDLENVVVDAISVNTSSIVAEALDLLMEIALILPQDLSDISPELLLEIKAKMPLILKILALFRNAYDAGDGLAAYHAFEAVDIVLGRVVALNRFYNIVDAERAILLNAYIDAIDVLEDEFINQLNEPEADPLDAVDDTDDDCDTECEPWGHVM